MDSEPETTAASQPAAGRLRARLRATCAEPPRGKNTSPISTRCTGGTLLANRPGSHRRPMSARLDRRVELSFRRAIIPDVAPEVTDFSAAIEDYAKAIYELEARQD